MRHDKTKALELRRSGVSYQNISQTLNIPKSTLSNWMRDVKWSQQVRKELEEQSKIASTHRIIELTNARKRDLAEIYENARIEARLEFEDFRYYPLFLVGVALYWGEGDRRSKYQVRLSNTDPAMIRTFVCFLTDVCGVPVAKIYASILMYPDIEMLACKTFWIESSQLNEQNFQKPIVIEGKHKTRKIPYGVCTVGVSSRFLKEKMLIWLSLIPEKLSRENMRAGIV